MAQMNERIRKVIENTVSGLKNFGEDEERAIEQVLDTLKEEIKILDVRLKKVREEKKMTPH